MFVVVVGGGDVIYWFALFKGGEGRGVLLKVSLVEFRPWLVL